MAALGFWEFIPHHRCARNDLLTADGQLELMIDVELLEEEVLSSKDLTTTETDKIIEDVKREVKKGVES